MSDVVIQTRSLTRYFGGKCALDQVSLSVPQGSVFALLGRNGSGKSTMIRILMGLLEPTRGSAEIMGEDCRSLSTPMRARVAYIAEGHPLISWMRVRDLERFQKGSYPTWNTKLFRAMLEHFNLNDTMKAGNLSRGQRAGLSLALSLATDPQVLVMDDPAMGLDPVARRTLLEAMIIVTRDAGHTIFFSSHLLDDVERVADHIAILDNSILRASCSLETFRAGIKKFRLAFTGDPPVLPNIPGLLQARRDKGELQITLANPNGQSEQILRSLGATSINELSVSLEDAVVGYLGDRGEKLSLLQQTREQGVAV